MKTAIIIGATGLVGSHLLELLKEDGRFGSVLVFGRRPSGPPHPKITEYIVDFDKPAEWRQYVAGDVLFSSLGTTIRKAGSQEAQYKIDYTYQFETAKMAAGAGTATYVLVSAANSDPASRIFYSRIKGELERDIRELPFSRIRIIRPGILDGDRKESRPMEKAAIGAARLFTHLPGFGKYRPIHAGIVAKAMINAFFDEEPGIKTYTLEEVFRVAGEKYK
jgi:uncharacterized protein YbjT (DUF2867 family)